MVSDIGNRVSKTVKDAEEKIRMMQLGDREAALAREQANRKFDEDSSRILKIVIRPIMNEFKAALEKEGHSCIVHEPLEQFGDIEHKFVRLEIMPKDSVRDAIEIKQPMAEYIVNKEDHAINFFMNKDYGSRARAVVMPLSQVTREIVEIQLLDFIKSSFEVTDHAKT